jgi:hypothetical protein
MPPVTATTDDFRLSTHEVRELNQLLEAYQEAAAGLLDALVEHYQRRECVFEAQPAHWQRGPEGKNAYRRIGFIRWWSDQINTDPAIDPDERVG